eukprot:1181110-Prorocentrum_minimum.AAC.5
MAYSMVTVTLTHCLTAGGPHLEDRGILVEHVDGVQHGVPRPDGEPKQLCCGGALPKAPEERRPHPLHLP